MIPFEFKIAEPDGFIHGNDLNEAGAFGELCGVECSPDGGVSIENNHD